MHYLARNVVQHPECLGRYRHGRHQWCNVTQDDRQEILNALEAMQGRRCAYCECDLDQHGNHIEHFRQRGRFPQGTFEWNNLFWSCLRGDSCGKHKDSCGEYDHSDVIKPDVEDPEQFFLFVYDGTITIRQTLTEEQRRRAEETLCVFNLNPHHGPLRQMRHAMISGYKKTAEDIQELAVLFPPDVWMPFFAEELAQTQDLPFCTAIKHVLTPQGIR